MPYQNPQNAGGTPASPGRFHTYKKDIRGPVGFKAGRGYYAKPGGTKRPAVTDPYAATSPAGIQAIIAKYTGGYGTPASDADLQKQAQGQIDPLIAAITKSVTDRTAQGSAAISANSDALAKSLAGIDYQAPYRQAAQSQAATDAALHAALTGGGAGLANDLSSRLGSISEPGAVNAAASAVAAEGAGAANASLASGSASLSQLLANQASAGEYGAKQPGIARSAGLQDISALQQAGQHDLTDQTAAILAKLPDIVSALRNDRNATRSERAQLATHLFEFLTGQNLSKANTRYNQKLAEQSNLIRGAHYANSDTTAANRASETARHNRQSETTQAKRASIAAANTAISSHKADLTAARDAEGKRPKPSATLSAKYGYIVDQYGEAILDKQGKKIPAKGTAKATKPATKWSDTPGKKP